MDKINQLRADIAYVEAELATIHERNADQRLDGDDKSAWDAGVEFVNNARTELADLEERQRIVDRATDQPTPQRGDAGARDVPNFNRDHAADVDEVLSDRSATSDQLADVVYRSLDERDVDDTVFRRLARRHRRDVDWVRNLAARSTDVYADAWQGYILGREMILTNEQRAALSVGTNANGGFLVPTHLDPTIILTNDGSANALRPISRVVTLTGGANQWNGVSSAGVTASWDGELAEVSDDSPNDIAQPGIPVHKAQALVQASIESFEDIDGLAADVLMLFGDARDRLEGAAHCTGSGSDQPTGIFTALDANTNVEVTSTTAATIGLVDLQGLRRAVGQRFRGRASWVYNPVYGDAIKALGTAISATYSTDITQANTERLLGRPVVETDDAPETQTTTVRDNELVFGDFSNYVIVDKPGSTSVEFVPHLFHVDNNLPNGRRGWYMHFRSGADSVNDLAFRLLQDKTSA